MLTCPCRYRQATCKYSSRLYSLRRKRRNWSRLFPRPSPPLCCQIGEGQRAHCIIICLTWIGLYYFCATGAEVTQKHFRTAALLGWQFGSALLATLARAHLLTTCRADGGIPPAGQARALSEIISPCSLTLITLTGSSPLCRRDFKSAPRI